MRKFSSLWLKAEIKLRSTQQLYLKIILTCIAILLFLLVLQLSDFHVSITHHSGLGSSGP